MMPVIALDCMGGDNAPAINIEGALSALNEETNLKIILLGPKNVINNELFARGIVLSEQLSIAHAENNISMFDSAPSAMKKNNSSISVGLRLVKEKKAHAFISAGNSGAVMTTALMVLGRIKGIDRPAIIVKIPHATGSVLLLDAGANVDCTPTHLFQFAEMGRIYAEIIENKKNPKIGLIANGSETTKGNKLTKKCHELFLKGSFNYIGYIEGFDLFRGNVDVAVCDGFIGNIILKTTEGLSETTRRWLRSEIKKDIIGLTGLILLKKVLTNFKNRFDSEPYGAAPLIGINGVVFIAHGSSSSVAIKNGIINASKAITTNLNKVIGFHMKKAIQK